MIIVISGRARSGKDTAAEILQTLINNKGESCRLVAYADYLKKIAGDCFGLTWEQLYGDLKEAPICDMPIRTSSGNVTEHLWTARKLLQYLGTDVFRKINPDCWINAVKNRVINDSHYDNIVITDARFDNEVEWVLQKGGIRIHVERGSKDFCSGLEHASENSLTSFESDLGNYIVYNNRSFDYLKEELGYIIEPFIG